MAIITPWAACACLPVGDVSPPPGRLLFTVSGSETTREGIAGGETQDGYSIRFNRAWITMGNAFVSDCDQVSTGNYSRLFDLQRTDRAKLSLLYAEGACHPGLSLPPPEDDTVLGPGVAPGQLEAMLDGATPPEDREALWGEASPVSGSVGPVPQLEFESPIVFWLKGETEGPEGRFTFDWQIRNPAGLWSCSGPEDGSRVEISVPSDSQREFALVVRPEELFRVGTEQFQFAPMAAADTFHGNDDGHITTEELSNTPLSAVAFGAGSEAPEGLSLGQWLWLRLATHVVQPASGGACGVDVALPE